MPEFDVHGEMVAKVHKRVTARTLEAAKRKAVQETGELWWFDDYQANDVKVTGAEQVTTAHI